MQLLQQFQWLVHYRWQLVRKLLTHQVQRLYPATKLTQTANKIVNVGTPTDTTDGANKAYVDTQPINQSNGATWCLDTLNELAAAMGDNANHRRPTNAIATKADQHTRYNKR